MTKIDLWNEFEEEGPENPSDSSKPTARDGSEWTGRFDRRKQPRTEEAQEAADRGIAEADADAQDSSDTDASNEAVDEIPRHSANMDSSGADDIADAA